jgi:hypothetical protein
MNAREGRDFQRVYTERVRRKLLQLAQDWGVGDRRWSEAPSSPDPRSTRGDGRVGA